MLSLDYDSKFDVLYINLDDLINSFGDEEYDGLVVRRNKTSKKIVGFTIFGFDKKISLDKLPELPSDATINWKNDVLPIFYSEYKS